MMDPYALAEFIDADWGDKVNSGIGVVPGHQAPWAGGQCPNPKSPYGG